MPKQKKKNRQAALTLGWEFIKLQIAGNIPFWGTYFINAFLDKALRIDTFQSLLIGTIIANAVFFVVDDRWVFRDKKGHRKTSTKIIRFVLFMSFSALLTFNITWLLYSVFGVTTYIGQFISAGLSITWTFVGLRFWVFAPEKKMDTKSKQQPHRKLVAAKH